MKKNFPLVILLIIVAIGAFFRLFMLTSVPPSPSLDEVSIGYNAYSILHTGRDEYGNFLPLLLRAYDDYRPALYVYIIIPFIKLFGLTIFAVRLPSVLLSLVTIIVSYFLVLELLSKNAYKKNIALLTAFLLAISPWNVYISRLGHEANLGLTCAVVGIYTFLYAVHHEKKRWILVISAIFFALSLDSYQSDKVFMPIMAILLGVLYYKKLWENKKIFFISIAVGILVSLPFILISFNPQGLTRFDSTSAFSNIKLVYQQTAQKLLIDKQQHNLLGEILDNRRMVVPIIFSQNFISHFNPLWLFGNGGHDSFKAPGVGLLYSWEFIFIIFGIIYSFFLPGKTKIILFGWVIAALVAPSITTQSPHAMRAMNVLPIPQIFVALGVFGITQLFIFRKWRKILISIYIIIIGFFTLSQGVYFHKQYFYVFPQEESGMFQYSLSHAIQYAIAQENKYDHIVISNRNHLLQSYMFYLYYSKYNPQEYLKNGGTKSGGFAEWHTIGKFDFRPVNWSKDQYLKSTLIIANASSFPSDIGYTEAFKRKNGEITILAIGK